MYAGLSLDQAPPILVPFRFFLTAPLFALLAGLMLLYLGPDLLQTRWSLPMLGFTHAMTLGFLGMIMCGALFQMLPVVAGAPVRNERLVALIVHALLTSGTALLVGGFVFANTLAFKFAIPFLAVGFLVMIVAIARSLLAAPRSHDTVRGMRIAVIGLTITVALGVYLGAAYAWGIPLARGVLTNLHLSWGLLGWVATLVVVVAYQVVPMFQMTPEYPVRLRRFLAMAIFIALCALTLVEILAPDLSLSLLLKATVAICLTVFSVWTLILQTRRRRKLPDVTLDFWRLGTVSLILAILWWVAGQFGGSWVHSNRYELVLALLFIGGFALSVVNGMLYKIVPFLVWLHLQNRLLADVSMVGAAVPNMKQILPDRRCRYQLKAQVLAIVLLFFTIVWDGILARPAAVLFVVSYSLLAANLVFAWRIYLREARRLDQLAYNTNSGSA